MTPPLLVDRERVDAVATRLDEVDAAFHAAVTLPTGREATRLRHLVRNLRLGRRLDLRAVDPGDLGLAPGGDRVPQCDRCADKCCADPLNEVSLRFIDLWRLQEAGLLGAVSTTAGRDDESVYRRLPVLAEAEGRDSFLRFPRLKKKPNGACVLYDEEAETCSVHPIRPLSCRQFPHHPRPDAPRLVGFSRRCSSSRPARSREVEAAKAAVAENWNAKVRDLVTLEHGQRPLAEVGLARWLPDVDEG